jgi:hypothetical protein
MAFEDLTKKQLKGIDLSVKAVSKRFPFVESWKFADDYQKYGTTLFIDLIVDYKKIGEYYGINLQPYYEKKLTDRPDSFKSSFFGTFFEGGYKYDTPEYREYIHRWWLRAQDIKEYADLIYKSLPEDFQILWSTERFPEYKHPINLNIQDFIQKN